MVALELGTVVYVPPCEAYDYLRAFAVGSDYAEHVERVRRVGDGGPGTEHRITVTWWQLSYTAVTRVTAVDPPNRIAWRSPKRPHAEGAWLVTGTDAPPDPPADVDPADATELRLRVEFAPDGVLGLDLPGPLDPAALVDRVVPVAAREAEAVAASMVADLEGRPREVDLTVHEAPRSL